MEDDETALRATIAAAPDDRAPRLIYADWLDEHGAPGLAAYFRTPAPPPLPGSTCAVPPLLPRDRWPAGLPRPCLLWAVPVAELAPD